MKDLGCKSLIILISTVWFLIFLFYGFLAYRAYLWSPYWAVSPTKSILRPLAPSAVFSEENPFIKKGKRLYQQLQCAVCHGPNGEGGVKNPNSDPDEVIPNLIGLEDAFTWDDLIDKIRQGSHPYKLDENKPDPPLEMPSWEEAVSEEELESLAEYLFSLKTNQSMPG